MEESHQWPQFLAVFLASFLSVGSGIQIGWTSPSVPKLLSGDIGFEVSATEASYIVMLSPLGYIIGCPLCGFLLDKIGRKYTLLTLAPFQIMTWITVIFSQNVTTLYVARVIMGMSDGGLYTALPAYIGEVVEPKVRGVASTSLSLGLLVGTLLINTYGSFLPIKMAACVSLACPVLFIITFMWMPESPYFLLAKGEDDKARASLRALRKIEDVEKELGNISRAVRRQMAEPGSFKDIVRVRTNFKAFSILAVLRTLQQLSGVYTVGFYMQTIFSAADSVLPPHVSAILCNSIRIPLTFIGSLMVDRFGRKIMISSSSLGTAITTTVLATYFYLQSSGYDLKSVKWIPLSVMIIYYIFCSLGLLLVPNLMMGELLPSNIKAKALSIMNIYFGLSMSLSSKFYHWAESSFGTHVPFYAFGTCCLLGVVFVYAFVPETKGKSLEEIQDMLKERKNIKQPTKHIEIYTIRTVD